MEFIDNCIILSIKQFRTIPSPTIFSKSYTEYEVTLKFHSKKLTQFRRYSQFRTLKSKIPPSLPLPPFPKKKLIENTSELRFSRKSLLEKWLQALLRYPHYTILLLEFLSVPSEIILSVRHSIGCKFNPAERSVARLLKKLKKIGKNGKSILKEFNEIFFAYSEFALSPKVLRLLIDTLTLLSGQENVACAAIKIIHKMISLEYYRFAEIVKDELFTDLSLMKAMKIDKHLLNEFKETTGLQGYLIAKAMKEHLERKSMGHYFKAAINCNDQALNQFFVRSEGRICGNVLYRYVKSDLGKWVFLYTDTCEAPKIAFRRLKECIEVNAEMLIKANFLVVAQFVVDLEKRRKWDLLLRDWHVLERSRNKSIVKCSFKSDRQGVVGLVCSTEQLESDAKILIKFESKALENEEFFEGCYEVSNGEDEERENSFSTEDEGDEGHISKVSEREDGIKRTKLVFNLKMNTKFARFFVSELSEETSVFKNSLLELKKITQLI